MSLIKSTKIQNGVYWVDIPEADLRILCGTPADSIKHLGKQGFLKPSMIDGQFYYEEGPNAILLSDRLWQNDRIANYSEFPILHMLYKQGILIPGHPHNALPKPLLIGHPKQLGQQVDYLFYGSYGVVDSHQYTAEGVGPRQISKTLSYKKRFAFGTFHSFRDLLELKPVQNDPVELRKGVMIHRKGSNLFQISFQGESCLIDLGLKFNETFEAPFQMPTVRLTPSTFSVVHIGEGDGWDCYRPCLGSMVQCEGKNYLIDAGPNVQRSLSSMGLSAMDIEGVIFTHVHDDHFAGFPELLRRHKGLKVYCSPRIRLNLIHKYASLLGLSVEEAQTHFEYHCLPEEQWTRIDGMEIYPFPSPHPIDTTIFVIRKEGPDGMKTYGHFADITALAWLEKMIVSRGNEGEGISKTFFDQIKKFYAQKLDLKKVDVGGVPIHGSEKDFIDDPSGKLVLSHTSKPLTDAQLAVGLQAAFGEQDILIP